MVYQYTCSKAGCHSSNQNQYIGYTTGTLKERMIQHQSIKKHHSNLHKSKIGYKDILKDIKILCKKNNKQELVLAEALLIKEMKPYLNSQEEGSTRILQVF